MEQRCSAAAAAEPVQTDRSALLKLGCSPSTRPSGRGALVAAQEPAEALVRDDVAAAGRGVAVDELVAESLVGPLSVIVGNVLAKHALEVALSEQNGALEALALHR